MCKTHDSQFSIEQGRSLLTVIIPFILYLIIPEGNTVWLSFRSNMGTARLTAN